MSSRPALHPDYPFAAPKQDRHGTWRWRFTKGARPMLKGQPGSAEFEASYQAAAEGRAVTVKPVASPAAVIVLPGTGRHCHPDAEKTLAAAWRLVRQSREWKGLGLDAQRQYTGIIENKILAVPIGAETWGDATFAEIERRHVLGLLTDVFEREGAGQERMVLLMLRKLFNAAIDAEWLKAGAINPLHEVKRAQPDTGGHKTWTPEAMAAYEARWPIGTPQRTAYALGLWLGARVSDIANLRWSMLVTEKMMVNGMLIEVRGFRFTVYKNSRRAARQGKKPTELFLPLTPMLEAELAPAIADAAQRRRNPFVVPNGNYDRGYTTRDSFQQAFTRWCRKAGLGAAVKGEKGFTPHGLRKALAVKLVNAGATTHQLMQIFGWKNIAFAELYAREIAQSRVAFEGIAKVVEMERQAGGMLKLIEGGKS